jgi:hypothetical protein
VERNVSLGIVVALLVLWTLLILGAELMTFIVVFSVLALVALTFMAARRTVGQKAAMGASRPPPPMVVPEHGTTIAPVRPARTATAKPSTHGAVTKPAPPGYFVGPAPRVDAAWAAAPQPPPRQPMPPRPAPPKGDLKARIAEVKAAIDTRPGGVPRELGLFDSWTIAERVVKGKTMTASDGTPLVEVMGEWYVDTPDDPGRFLQHWRE